MFISLICVLHGVAVAGRSGSAWKTPDGEKFTPGMSRRGRILFAIDRLTWGRRPGDMAAVNKVGLRRWIELQLHPHRIPQNAWLKEQLKTYTTLKMSSRQLVRTFPPPGVIKAIANGRRPLPGNPQARAIVLREVQLYRRRLGRKNDPAALARRHRARTRQLQALLGGKKFQALLRAPWPRRIAAWRALEAAKRRQIMPLLPRGMAVQLALRLPADTARQFELARFPQMVPLTDLQQARMLRAIYSTRQLKDVLADFWYNHFNIYFFKGADRFLTSSFEENVIRPRVLGKFSDLLIATAQSPAMLFYLDNWRSVAPGAGAAPRPMHAMLGRAQPGMPPFGYPAKFFPFPQRLRRRRPARPKFVRGINENYGRELMELHTLGVSGGYTQRDVDQAALCLTGWTIYRPQFAPRYWFNPRLHARGAKTVLGHRIEAGGEGDGLALLKLLADSPATARHISYELAERFVSEHPPAALINRMVAVWQRSHGNLRRVMQAMIFSPEFWNPVNRNAKVKPPLAMVASAARALTARVSNPERLVQVVAQMGEPLFLDFPPNGYSNRNPDWVSSAGLVDRMNFALALAHNQVPGVQVNLSPYGSGSGGAEAAMLRLVLDDRATAQTQAAVRQALSAPAPNSRYRLAQPQRLQLAAALLLGSPDFQRY